MERLVIKKRNDGSFAFAGLIYSTIGDAIKAAKNLIAHYPKDYIFDLFHCKFCGSKLVSDKLSKKYGNYCPNDNCEFLS